jgi:hypothetical protein
MSSKTTSKLKQYIAEISEDTNLDNFNIKDVQLKLPGIKHKYVSRLIVHKRRLAKLQQDKKSAQSQVINDLKEKSVYKLTEPMARKASQDHNSVKSIHDEILEEEVIVELLEKTERILSSMTYDIKNIIELMKLEIT